MKKPLHQLSWILVTTPTSAGACYFAAVTADKLMNIPPQFVEAAPSAGAAAALLWWTGHQFGQMGSRSSRLTVPKFSLSQAGWAAQQFDDFEFAGAGLPQPIPEDMLMRFCKIAWLRQVNAFYGSKFTMMRSQAGWKRLTARQIFTESYFRNEIRPRFTELDYDSCLYILQRCNLILGRRAGTGGRLRFDPVTTVTMARSRWYATPPPRGQLSQLIANFPPSLGVTRWN